MATLGDRCVYQHGALPFVIGRRGKIKILLVTTRGRGDWIIPKGWPVRGLTAAATAEREAFEEAGVVGSIVGDKPVGSYRYEKRGTARKLIRCEVSVFLLAVERQLRQWPEKSQRNTRWFAPEDAAKVVATAGLADLVRDVVGFMLVNVARSEAWQRVAHPIELASEAKECLPGVDATPEIVGQTIASRHRNPQSR